MSLPPPTSQSDRNHFEATIYAADRHNDKTMISGDFLAKPERGLKLQIFENMAWDGRALELSQ